MWRPGIGRGSPSPPPLKQGLSLNLELCGWLSFLASEPPGLVDLHLPALGLEAHISIPSFFGGSGGAENPHICMAGTLFTEPTWSPELLP